MFDPYKSLECLTDLDFFQMHFLVSTAKQVNIRKLT